MHKTKVIPIAIIAILFCSLIRAEEVSAGGGSAYGGEKTEMIQEIKDEVDWDDAILEYIPELKIQKDKDGKDIYSYLVKGKQVNLENLDEKALSAVLDQVRTKSAQLKVDVMREQQAQRKQLDTITRPPDVPRPPRR